MSKGSVGLIILIIGGMIIIWYEILFKLRVYFDKLVSTKKVLLESSYRIETCIDVVENFIEVQISVAFELYFDDDFIEFC